MLRLPHKAQGALTVAALVVGGCMYLLWIVGIPLLPGDSVLPEWFPTPWAGLVPPAAFYAGAVAMTMIVAGYSLATLS